MAPPITQPAWLFWEDKMPVVDNVNYDLWNQTYTKATVNVLQLDTDLRAALGDDISGVSAGGGDVMVHFLDLGGDTTLEAINGGLVANVNTANAIVNGHHALSPSASLASIAANGVAESVITVPGLTVFDYKLWLNGVVVASGSIADGSLEFSTDTPGVYTVEVFNGDDTGYITVTAT
jgi:hypothetical protein